jgi:hypothetical protein
MFKKKQHQKLQPKEGNAVMEWWFVVERDPEMRSNKLGSKVVWISELYDNSSDAKQVRDYLNEAVRDEEHTDILQIFKLDPWSALKRYEVHKVIR